MIEINLIPDVKQELLKAQKQRAVVISGAIFASIVAAGIVVVMLVYIYAFQLVRHNNLDGNIKTANNNLTQVEDLSKILTIQKQLSVINTVNGEKNMDSRIFDVISAIVPPAPNQSLLSKINVDNEASTITLDGQTANYANLEIFKKTLDNAIIVYTEDGEKREIKLADTITEGNVAYGTDANNQKVVIFSLSFTYAEELFSPKLATVDIKLSINGNVTDSYLGIPRSLYTEPAKETEE